MFYKNDAQISPEVQNYAVVIIVLVYLYIQQLCEIRFLNLKCPNTVRRWLMEKSERKGGRRQRGAFPRQQRYRPWHANFLASGWVILDQCQVQVVAPPCTQYIDSTNIWAPIVYQVRTRHWKFNIKRQCPSLMIFVLKVPHKNICFINIIVWECRETVLCIF